MRIRYKRLSILIAFIVCVSMCFAGTGSVFAEGDVDDVTDSTESSNEETTTIQAAVAVYSGEQLVKTYTMDELRDMEDPEEYTYSAFNSYPTDQLLVGVRGVRISRLLDETVGEPIDEKQVIEIVGSDGAGMKFTGEQILSERYYFPHFQNESGRKGQKALAGSSADKQIVPAMISLDEPNCESADEPGRLVFGQISPTEQNYSGFVKYIARGDKNFNTDTGLVEGSSRTIGKIIIHSNQAPKLNALKKTNVGTGGAVRYGTVITFDRNINAVPKKVSERYCVYFTTDGSIPDMTSNLYNFNNFEFGTAKEQFYKVKIAKEGTITIKTKVVGYGRQDSDVSTFRFTGVKNPATPRITKITTKKKAITLKWNKIAGATGYKIYRATKKNGKYSLVKTIKGNRTITWKNKKLKKKKKYFYKILAYKTVQGKTFNSGYSAVKYKKVK